MPRRKSQKRVPLRVALARQRAKKQVMMSRGASCSSSCSSSSSCSDESIETEISLYTPSSSEEDDDDEEEEEEEEEEEWKPNEMKEGKDGLLTNIKITLSDLGLNNYLASTVGGKMVTYLTLHICIPFNNLNYKSKSVITTLISRVALFLKNNFEVLPSEETLVDICKRSSYISLIFT